jgi:hypothetical protein
MPALVSILFLVAAFASFFAFMDGVHLLLGWGGLASFALFVGLHLIPGIGALAASGLALYGAMYAWDWTWWQAALLVFPSLILALVAGAAAGVGGLISKLRPASPQA